MYQFRFFTNCSTLFKMEIFCENFHYIPYQYFSWLTGRNSKEKESLIKTKERIFKKSPQRRIKYQSNICDQASRKLKTIFEEKLHQRCLKESYIRLCSIVSSLAATNLLTYTNKHDFLNGLTIERKMKCNPDSQWHLVIKQLQSFTKYSALI